jgi:paraquat-inducible protein B
MSDQQPPDPASDAAPDPAGDPTRDPTLGRLPEADIRQHGGRPFQLVWLIPIVAAIIAGWLAWHTWATEGPRIVITFNTGDGITAGQTQVRHKAVPLGTVRSVALTPDRSRVEVRLDMTAEAKGMLTPNAQFWVVRPRLTAGNVSGLDTVFSGSYIEMDPGPPSDARQTRFTGLEDPPAVRSGEPGTAYVLTADRIGSLSSGSPIFFRDITVGEVLDYLLGPTGNSVSIHVFLRAPFDKFVVATTHFWNVSGVSLNVGSEGVQLRLASLQAALSGGIAFDTARVEGDSKPSPADTIFPLYPDEASARAAGFERRIKLVVYFGESVRGLSVGAPVDLDGIQVGNVTDIKLLVDPKGVELPRVAVHIEVQPARFMPPDQIHPQNAARAASELVRRGLRAELATANFLTGQMLVSFDFVPDAAPFEVRQEGDELVIPGISGGLDSLTTNLGRIAAKLDALPLDQVTRNLSDSLHGISALVNGPELRQTLQAVTNAARQLPSVAQHADAALAGANRLVSSAAAGYGEGSDFRRGITRLLDQFSDAARSIRLLADYLDAHPEALIRGRAGQAAER